MSELTGICLEIKGDLDDVFNKKLELTDLMIEKTKTFYQTSHKGDFKEINIETKDFHQLLTDIFEIYNLTKSEKLTTQEQRLYSILKPEIELFLERDNLKNSSNP